jgi:nitroimidazol reductase NimA-like FMN-containing flavoprotein (pyridoxamine 5'-phosphate oxidase superfamily)
MRFSREEIRFLESNEACRLATASKDALPHVTPVCYIFENGYFYIFIDYGTKKFKNVKENPKVSLVVDIYRQPSNRAVFIQGSVEILEKGKEYREMYEKFYKKFYWVRADPWREGEAPLLKVKPERKVSWGL